MYNVLRRGPPKARFRMIAGVRIVPRYSPCRSITCTPEAVATYRRPFESMAIPSARLRKPHGGHCSGSCSSANRRLSGPTATSGPPDALSSRREESCPNLSIPEVQTVCTSQVLCTPGAIAGSLLSLPQFLQQPDRVRPQTLAANRTVSCNQVAHSRFRAPGCTTENPSAQTVFPQFSPQRQRSDFSISWVCQLRFIFAHYKIRCFPRPLARGQISRHITARFLCALALMAQIQQSHAVRCAVLHTTQAYLARRHHSVDAKGLRVVRFVNSLSFAPNRHPQSGCCGLRFATALRLPVSLSCAALKFA